MSFFKQLWEKATQAINQPAAAYAQKVTEVKASNPKEFYLLLQDGYWFLLYPAGANGKRPAVKLCPKLTIVETAGQFSTGRMIELGLTAKAEEKLQEIEAAGGVVNRPG